MSYVFTLRILLLKKKQHFHKTVFLLSAAVDTDRVHVAHGLLSLAGRGSRKGAAQMCMSCHGTGMQVRVHQLLPGMVQQVSTVCHSCQGQGQRVSHKDRCKTCGGRKIMRQKKILEVHIDKGIRAGIIINSSSVLICIKKVSNMWPH